VKAVSEADHVPVGEEHWAQKGDVRLFLWRKRLAEPTMGPPLLLVHGSSLSALPSYDLVVPGHPDYSMMDWFAREGFDVWTLDHEGYGRSTVTESNADIACGVEDLRAAVLLIRNVTGTRKLSLYGLSSGSLRAAAYAAAEPGSVSHLVLDAFVYTGEGSPTLAKRKEGLEFFRTHNRRPIDREFIKGIFTRDKPGTTEPAVAEAVAEAQLVFGDSVPTGTYLDMTQNLPVVDPRAIRAPTFIVRGEHDGIASMEDLLEFFRLLPGNDKQIAVLPELAHSTQLGVHRHRMWEAVRAFLRRNA
jgi:pimeloyl-ACP methyl ester carboxylesterase